MYPIIDSQDLKYLFFRISCGDFQPHEVPEYVNTQYTQVIVSVCVCIMYYRDIQGDS